MTALSASIITLNEERHLARAISSLAEIADEIVVVDSGSTDRTGEIACQHGATFLSRTWTNYAEQKNFAAQNASHDWIFSLDADEELSSELRAALLAWKQQAPQFQVYEVSRRAWYLGAWIRHSGWYPDYQRRLYRRDVAQFSGIIHEAVRYGGTLGRLDGDLLHYTIDTFAEHEQKVEHYTGLAAQQMFASGRRSWRAAQWFGTPWSWLQNYFLRGGMLDGYRGALIAQMAARSVRLKYRKLGELVRAECRHGGEVEK
ncbi:MAG: glycosyltransferase family 2 protein [Candidatus Acidiferrum sp.]|jgi:glycosyltransferase involved in cell wall biosynthesis